MKHYLAMLAGAVSVAALTFVPAWAIDVQPGGKGGAAVTVGQAITDDDDETIDRCECDGGPLESIVVNIAGGGTDPVRVDRVVGASARTNDGFAVGAVIKADNNTGDNAIVIIVRVDDDSLPVDRIAVRRTAFYYDDGVIIIDTSMADLLSSVQSGANAGA